MTSYEHVERISGEMETALGKPRLDLDELRQLIDEAKGQWVKLNWAMVKLAAQKGDPDTIVAWSDALNKASLWTQAAQLKMPGTMIGG